MLTGVSVHPVGPEALVTALGKKKDPGIQAYQMEAIGVVVPLPSLKTSV